MEIKQYIKDFEKLGVGLFVHFGLYSLLKKGEWTMEMHNIPAVEYEALANDFEVAPDFADKLVLSAKQAGAKYITFTTRHHDGFSLYDTRGLNEYDSMHSACKRDIVKEFVDACRKHNIIPFLYHTTLDWRSADFENDFPRYQKYLRESIKILCTRYGKIGGFWFDGNWSKESADWEEDELYGLIRFYQPETLIINNSGLSHPGAVSQHQIDCVTYERSVPRSGCSGGRYVAKEMCEVLNSHWGYAKWDISYKPLKEIIKKLTYSRHQGANFLLNIGLTSDGSLRGIDKEYLVMLGIWMGINGEAVYDVLPTPYYSATDDYAVKTKNGTFYLFVNGLFMISDPNVGFSLDVKKNVLLCGFKKKIKKVFWLDNGEELSFSHTDDGYEIACSHYRYGTNLTVRVAKIVI